jgi:hypothetical protein
MLRFVTVLLSSLRAVALVSDDLACSGGARQRHRQYSLQGCAYLGQLYCCVTNPGLRAADVISAVKNRKAVMSTWKKSQWSLALLIGAGAWAVVDVLADTYRRKRAKTEAASDVQEWENEGGALPATETRGP